VPPTSELDRSACLLGLLWTSACQLKPASKVQCWVHNHAVQHSRKASLVHPPASSATTAYMLGLDQWRVPPMIRCAEWLVATGIAILLVAISHYVQRIIDGTLHWSSPSMYAAALHCTPWRAAQSRIRVDMTFPGQAAGGWPTNTNQRKGATTVARLVASRCAARRPAATAAATYLPLNRLQHEHAADAAVIVSAAEGGAGQRILKRGCFRRRASSGGAWRQHLRWRGPQHEGVHRGPQTTLAVYSGPGWPDATPT
jgi:hypothetical protein